MWQLMPDRLALGLLEKAHGQTAKEFGRWIAGEIMGTERLMRVTEHNTRINYEGAGSPISLTRFPFCSI
jgi:hypothetical protein